MSKYTVAGVSRFKGQVKVRFANDLSRVKLLIKAGNTDIELIELPEPLTKPQVTLALKESELYNVPEYAEAIDEAIEKYNPPVKVKKAKTEKKPDLAEIKARAAKLAELA